MTKQELLKKIDYSIKNKCCLMLKAGDYFTDYIKVVSRHTLLSFRKEVWSYGIDCQERGYEDSKIKISSIDIYTIGSLDKNQYYVFDARPVASEEIEALASMIDFRV